MRIVYIAAGAGDTYCGACARDVVLVRGLLAAGHSVQMIPLYTPLKLEEGGLPIEPVFFGGVNVFLQQATGLFRHLPMFLDRVLDRPGFLRWASRFSLAVDPGKLGPMTVSVLQGIDGRQRKEVARLMAYLEKSERPDVVNLTNSMLCALAPEIKRRLKVPVICTFQGEDQFIRELGEPHTTTAEQLIRRHAADVDLFVCPNQAMVGDVAAFLGVAEDKVRVVRTAVESAERTVRSADPFIVGYLSTIRPAKGLDILLEAVRVLIKDRTMPLKFVVAGRVADPKYWENISQRGKEAGLQQTVEYLGEVDAAGKEKFFRRASVLVSPSRYAEPRGVVALEAMAAGLPVIVPATGVFPELLDSRDGSAAAGGGVMVTGENPNAWADAIANLAHHPALLQRLSIEGRENMRQNCSPEKMAAETIALYEKLLAPKPTPGTAG